MIVKMRVKVDAWIRLRFLYSLFLPKPTSLSSSSSHSLQRTLTNLKACLFTTTVTATSPASQDVESALASADLKDSAIAGLFRGCGCTDSQIMKIFVRQPSLLKSEVEILQSKLNILRGLGLTGSDIVKIIHCRPRFLASRINHSLDERVDFLQQFFGSREMLLKAIVRNPSLLNYSLYDKLKSCIALYESMGIARQDLIYLLMSRPTLISRTSLDNEKMEYIRRTGLSKDSKMYKYVLTLIAVSRMETIREKMGNLEKYGFSTDEIMNLISRSPLVLTLSIDKVQRNMTFIIGTMKLPASVVLDYPFLLFLNLETVLRPRVLLAEKIRAMGLLQQIKGCTVLRVLRMSEPRFLKKFVTCHTNDVAKSLMEFYQETKGIRRLAESSKRVVYKGFPF
ncbi:PREDICTED: uncharacterized protein LOC104597637 [Nelumbo nucifera]|uniref:Uncharacterized protein LOC104597637 n=2 Tax=Nelumbo nucifera TaxID=4432 RepID=A0A1U8A7Z1_NELNU|nr:PREDICTED: uncharacterized protein LOC104597637 [Nelumbo nucifera]XP_019053323.1 PREDICTED: uncharacterized protein LOC104597637 [Nelumbo nucifera]DAD42119.1 TPA_asm: hypothetical protein HUJ06_000349 [Nelumbo nucifera]